MKAGKTLAALALGLLFFCTAGCYAAETTTYDLEELGLSIELSDQLSTVTRDTDADDPVYKAFGMEKDTMDQQLKDGDIYLDAVAWTPELEYEITITRVQREAENFCYWSDNALEFLAELVAEDLEERGCTSIRSELYFHPREKFIKLYSSQTLETLDVATLQYCTIYNDQFIAITLFSYTGKWEEKYEELLKNVVDSIDFWEGAEGEKSEAFSYTHMETGLRFTVPAGWKEVPLSKQRDFLVAKFVPEEAGGDSILFGCMDYWAELPTEEKRGYTRGDLDNSLLTELRKELPEEEFVSLFCDDVSQVEKVSSVFCGGLEYIKIDLKETVSVYGLEVPVAVTSLFRVENGYLYNFQFSGTDTAWYYSDFETLVNSVSYPPASPSASGSSESSNVVIGVAVGGALLVVILLALKFMPGPKKKGEQTSAQIPSRSTPPVTPFWEQSQEPSLSEPRRYCRWCGNLIPEDCFYCPHCGKKLEEGGETS